MITYQDVFSQYYSSNLYQQILLNRAFYEFIHNLGQESPVVNLLARAMDAMSKRNEIHPDDFINKVLVPCGFPTWNDLQESWSLPLDQTGFNSSAFLNIIDPKVPDLGTLQIKSWNEFIYNIRLITGIHPFDINTEDSEYQLFHSSQIPTLVDANPTRHWLWQEEISDCDDFVRGTLGWLSKWNCGNYGVVSITAAVSQGSNEFMHAFLGILTSDFRFYLWEPQSKAYWEYGTPSGTSWELVSLDQIRV